MKTIIIAVVAIIFFTALLTLDQIGELSFVSLLSLTALISIVVQLFPRLKELDLKNLKLVLQEIKDTKEEIYAREEDLKKISYQTLLILTFNSVTQGRMGSKESWKLQRQWFQKNLAALTDSLHYTEDERSELVKYMNKYNEFDHLLSDRDSLQTTDPDYKEVKEKLNEISAEIQEMLSKDIAK